MLELLRRTGLPSACLCLAVSTCALPGCEAPEPQSGPFSIDARLSSEVRRDAPGTVGLVTWSFDTGRPSRAFIEFGLTRDYGMVAPADLKRSPYRAVLLGMKPRRTYHFRITVEQADGTISRSTDRVLNTGPATNLVTVSKRDVFAPAAREPGFILSTLLSPSDMNGRLVFIVDADGDIVWWYPVERRGAEITRARISCDGRSLWLIYSNNTGENGELRRVTLDALHSETYDIPGASHDITPVTDDIMAFIDYTEACSRIVEITPAGDTRVVYDTARIFAGGPCHSNALRYSATEAVYTLSDLNHHDILQVTRDGELLWRLEEMPRADWSGYQHGHHLLDESIVIFDNGAPGDSAVVRELALEDGETIFRYDAGIQSRLLGDVQRLPGGNTLVVYSMAGVIQEIDPEGGRVMSLSIPAELGYATWRDSLYGPPPDIEL